MGNRLQGLASEPGLLWRVLFWAAVNWLLDAASLWVFLLAFGPALDPDGLIVAFGLANVFAVVPITPGGLGIIEGIYIPTLVGFGLTRAAGSTKILNLTSNIGALTLFIPTGQVVWPVALAMAAGQFIGGYLGAMTGIRFGARVIRPLVVLVSIAMAIALLRPTVRHPHLAATSLRARLAIPAPALRPATIARPCCRRRRATARRWR